jgi:hypothetical protein
MSASLVFFLISLAFCIVALLCGGSILEAVRQWEAWAFAALVTAMVTLTTLRSVL